MTDPKMTDPKMTDPKMTDRAVAEAPVIGAPTSVTPRPKPARRRITLDGQLMTYWEREAARLDTLAASARWRWMARGYARKAERARMQAARSGAREAQRDRGGVAPA